MPQINDIQARQDAVTEASRARARRAIQRRQENNGQNPLGRQPQPPTAGVTPDQPASQSARQILAARTAVAGTTFQNRAQDPEYVEALLRAHRDRARDLARRRQRQQQGQQSSGPQTSPAEEQLRAQQQREIAQQRARQEQLAREQREQRQKQREKQNIAGKNSGKAFMKDALRTTSDPKHPQHNEFRGKLPKPSKTEVERKKELTALAPKGMNLPVPRTQTGTSNEASASSSRTTQRSNASGQVSTSGSRTTQRSSVSQQTGVSGARTTRIPRSSRR